MKTKRSLANRALVLLCSLLIVGGLGGPAFAQTELKPGFNLFSPEQDVEIGRQSSKEVEKELPVLHERRVEAYLNRVGERLAKQAPGAKYPYEFGLINASDINAFALPGGPVYLNRGLVDAAGSEAELAGVMAHEIAHVALRHGTNQASKAYLAQAGFGLLGGLLGNGNTGQIVGAVGGFGLNAVFLKFSRSAEEQADVLGAQILARAGYDPIAMVDFFERLRAMSDHDPGKVEKFFSSHPAPADRARRVRQELDLIGRVQSRRPEGDLRGIQARLDRLPAAPTQNASNDRGSNGQVAGIERPSSRFRGYRHPSGLYRIDYPDNWRVSEAGQGFGITIVPDGGVVNYQGRQEIVYGAIVNHYETFRNSSYSRFRDPNPDRQLREATEDLAHQLLRSNSYLEIIENSWDRGEVADQAGLSVVLAGLSPVTREQEQVTIFTRFLPDGDILYTLFVAPAADQRALSNTFQRMLSSLQVNDEAHSGF